ncbi:hypothetical protein QAD02_003520 [Eretmocerus hayati]|uniref:Uncharacterized protein n=1 Tax=Eretmocerus hayati TaxID=131215 RepID=A0ACC2NMA8_9HYME|nr:hypothetical protein QAD02_003520 [Eretmocerus hayati]
MHISTSSYIHYFLADPFFFLLILQRLAIVTLILTISYQDVPHERRVPGDNEEQPSKERKATPWAPDYWSQNFENWLMEDSQNRDRYARSGHCDKSLYFFGKKDIDRHQKSPLHEAVIELAKKENRYVEIEIQEPFKSRVKRLKMIIVMFIAENSMSVHLIKNLVPFLRRLANSPDDPLAHIQMKDGKCTRIIEDVLYEEAISVVAHNLNFTHWSPMMDESTDIGKMKILTASGQFVDPLTRKVVRMLLGLIEIDPLNAKASDILDALTRFRGKQTST